MPKKEIFCLSQKKRFFLDKKMFFFVLSKEVFFLAEKKMFFLVGARGRRVKGGRPKGRMIEGQGGGRVKGNQRVEGYMGKG